MFTHETLLFPHNYRHKMPSDDGPNTLTIAYFMKKNGMLLCCFLGAHSEMNSLFYVLEKRGVMQLAQQYFAKLA